MAIETCFVCGDPTGRAGAGEDSIYIDDIGPFDEKCYDILSAHFLAEFQAKAVEAVGSIKKWGIEEDGLIVTMIELPEAIEAIKGVTL